MRHSLISFLLMVLISSAAWAGSEYFNAPQEFPDLFLSQELREKPSLSKAELMPREQLLNEALASVYQRMTIPLIQDDGKVHITRAFPYLQKLISEKAQGEFKIYAAGGVVRSALAFLYAEMYKRWLQDPHFDSTEFLKNFAMETNDLPGIQVRGIGSDFDILIKDPTQQNTRLKEEILQIINSAETKFGLTSFQDELKKTMVTVGDVKSYDEQIERATAQGGSTLDFLTFDISEGKLDEPPRFPNTISDFLRGSISYAAPSSKAVTEDASKQTVRGLRPLLELPFVRYKDDTLLRTELKDLERTGLSARATEQVEKLARNARFSGANNRFYRGAPHSLEQLIHQVLQNKGLLSQIPRYIDLNPLQQRGEDRGLNGFPAKLLMTRERLNQLTSGGTLYHGTPLLNSGLSIMRSGLIESSQVQGRAMFGRGAYSTPEPSTALTYARGLGIVFRVQVKNDPRVNIIDWEEVKDDSFVRKLERECSAKNLDLFQELSRRHNIDIIYNNHFLIENQDAIILPSSFADLLESYRLRILAQATPWTDKLEVLRYYINYARYAADLGVHIVSPSTLISQLISTGHYSANQILTLFKYSGVSLDDLSYAQVEWVKKIFLKDFSNQPKPQQNEILQLLLKRSSAEQAANRFALNDAEIDQLQRQAEALNSSRELKIHFISLKAKPSTAEIEEVLRAVQDGTLSEKLTAIPAVYRITGKDQAWVDFVRSLLETRGSSQFKSKDLISFFNFSNDLKNPSQEMKKIVLAVAPQLGTQQVLFSELFLNPHWFQDLREILNAFDGAKNDDLIYDKILLDSRWSGSAELDQFLLKEIQNGRRTKVFDALMSSSTSSRLRNNMAVRAALVQSVIENYSSSLIRDLLEMNPPLTPEMTDALLFGAVQAQKEIPSIFLRRKISIQHLPKTFAFIQANPEYLRLKVPEATMLTMIRTDLKMIDLATPIAKYDSMIALSLQSNPSLLDRPAVQQWLKKQMQLETSKAFLLPFLTDEQVIQRPDWVSWASFYIQQKPESRDALLLSPTVRANKAQLAAFEKTLGAKPVLNKKDILKINQLRPQDLAQAAQIPVAELLPGEMAKILSSAKALKKSAKYHQVMDSYLSDPRFKIYLFPDFSEVFDSLSPELQRKALSVLAKESSISNISILVTNPSSLTTMASLPEADQTLLADKYMQSSKIELLFDKKDPQAEPLKTLLPKFINAARKTKNLRALSYFLTSHVSLTNKNDLILMASLDANAALTYIFKYQRFDSDSLQALRELANKKDVTMPLVRKIVLTPHFPNRTAWLETLVQSKPGFDSLMIETRKRDPEFLLTDPAFTQVMTAALKVNYRSVDMAQRIADVSLQKPAIARVLFSAWLQTGDKIQALAQAFANNDFLKQNPDLLQALAHSQTGNPAVQRIYLKNPLWSSLLQKAPAQKLKCSALFL